MANVDGTRQKLDHAFELILLLIGIVTGAIFQYITTLGDSSLVTFGMRFMLIPLIPLILLWIVGQITNSQSLQTFIVIFVWLFGIFTLFNDILFFLVVSFIKQFASSNPYLIITPIVLYFVASLFELQMLRMRGFYKKEMIPMILCAFGIAISFTAVIAYVSFYVG